MVVLAVVRGRLAVVRRVRRLVRGQAVRCWRLSRDMRIHILGICGTFMAGIAAIAREAGHTVTGSDANAWPPMSTQLDALGITLMQGSEPAHLQPAQDMVVGGTVVTRGHAARE